jgi:hypothetical protein
MHCGGPLGTRDHVPSRVFLDEPHPDNLPVVPSCGPCNGSFSLDEEYLACLIDCVLAGSADPTKISRPKIAGILKRNPSLAARLAQARNADAANGGILFSAEMPRVKNVILKLARGHSAFELREPHFEDPENIWIAPLTGPSVLSDQSDLRRTDVRVELRANDGLDDPHAVGRNLAGLDALLL